MKNKALTLSTISTPIGTMHALADHKKVYLLQFADKPGLAQEIQKMGFQLKTTIQPGTNPVASKVQHEITEYFAGTRSIFSVPLHLVGTPFQQQAWHYLQTIPYGSTTSYKNQAQALRSPKAFQAVARANATNHIALLIPCHRVINASGNLSGYAGGVHRKQYLLDLEQRYAQ